MQVLESEGNPAAPLEGDLYPIAIFFGFLQLPNNLFTMGMILSCFYDIKRRYYLGFSVRRLVCGMPCEQVQAWLGRESKVVEASIRRTDEYEAPPFVRERCLLGVTEDMDDFVPRIALTARSVRTWSAMERSARFLGEGFYCRVEVFITSVAFYFGCIFLFMMWFRECSSSLSGFLKA